MKLVVFPIITSFLLYSCKPTDVNDAHTQSEWTVDFHDNFDFFNPENWQDQRIWVNNENHCYVPDGQYNTREVSKGFLKLKVVRLE